MAKECIFGLTIAYMKDNIVSTKNMVLAVIPTAIDVNTSDNGTKTNDMAKEQ